jgi:phosphatidylglycerophosphate synthase
MARRLGNKDQAGLKHKKPKEFLNYFGKDRPLQLWLRDKRTRFTEAVFPRFVRLGLVPDTVSYIGIALLVGVAIYFVRDPLIAAAFLGGHVICDGLDGAFARNSGKASQSGAFTDLVCDQTGMVLVSMMAIFHGFVSPVLGAVYITLYLIVVVFGVLINVLDVGARITITSKYFLYLVYLAWAIWDVNHIPKLMYFFSAIMAVEVVLGYIRLKRGIRFKYDSKVRFADGDPYSGSLNYALNVSAPILILAVILIGANSVLLKSFFDTPSTTVVWQKRTQIQKGILQGEIIGFSAYKGNYLVMTRTDDSRLIINLVDPKDNKISGVFEAPSYITPTINCFPIDGDTLLTPDRFTNMLFGLDLKASFESGRALITMTIPMGHLKITGLCLGVYKGKPVWLAANYLYTRKTYIIDPEIARSEGSALKGKMASYINGAFPAGIIYRNGYIVEHNSSFINELLYVAQLSKLIEDSGVMEAAAASFLPPARFALGPILMDDDLVMLSRKGEFFSVPFDNVVK